MTPAEFIAAALEWAEEAHAQTGVLTSVILAQWAEETGWGGPDWSPNNNPGNVGSFDNQPVARFPTIAAGVAAYIDLMNAADRPEFAKTIRTGATPADQARLLGAANPVWASGRYDNGGGPGSALIAIIQDNNLAAYDSRPPNRKDPRVTSMTAGGQLHVFGPDGQGRPSHWWQNLPGTEPANAPADYFAWHVELLPAA